MAPFIVSGTSEDNHVCGPVIDQEGNLKGLICLDDILDLLSHEFHEIGRLLVDEKPASLVREWAGTAARANNSPQGRKIADI